MNLQVSLWICERGNALPVVSIYAKSWCFESHHEFYQPAFACFIDHRTRSAMKAANGSIFISMLARSSAAR